LTLCADAGEPAISVPTAAARIVQFLMAVLLASEPAPRHMTVSLEAVEPLSVTTRHVTAPFVAQLCGFGNPTVTPSRTNSCGASQ
jgi:hypothetical protein